MIAVRMGKQDVVAFHPIRRYGGISISREEGIKKQLLLAGVQTKAGMSEKCVLHKNRSFRNS